MDITPRFRPGQQIVLSGGSGKYPGIWNLVKVNPKNLILEQNGKRLNAFKGYCTIYDGTAPLPAVAQVAFRPTRTLPHQNPGAFLLYTGATYKTLQHNASVVVIADKDKMINVALIGGESNGRYYRIPADEFSPITPADLGL